MKERDETAIGHRVSEQAREPCSPTPPARALSRNTGLSPGGDEAARQALRLLARLFVRAYRAETACPAPAPDAAGLDSSDPQRPPVPPMGSNEGP